MRLASCTFLTVALAALAACGGGEATPITVKERTTVTVTRTVAAPVPARPKPAARCGPVADEPLGSRRTAFAAAARRAIAVHDRPHGRVVERFGRLNPNGVTTVFGVLARGVADGCEGAWYRVRLPRRPNGRTGWVRGRDVRLVEVRTRILVDLSARRVTLYRDGRKLVSTTAAVGATATPTPTGTYYVDQRLVAPDPRGPFGPGAVGIAAYSEVLTGWTQGGPVAIHGTNRPDLIGRAVSNGCIRVRNEMLRRIFRAAPEGTPVVIQS